MCDCEELAVSRNLPGFRSLLDNSP